MIRRVGQTVILLGLAALVVMAWLRLQTMQDVEAAQLEMVSVSLAQIAEDEVIAAEAVTETLTPESIQSNTDQPDQTFDLSNVPVLQDNSLVPAFNPRTFQGKLPEHNNFEIYVVKRGDTPVRIAEKFGIASETLLGGNPKLSEEAGLLQVDDEVVILPIDGVLHDVQPGDSLESVSALYNIPIEEIIAYEPNNLEFPFRLYADTQILVPGAKREVFQWDPPTLTSSGSGYWAGQSQPLVVGTGSFVWPVSARHITQVYWAGHPGLDIGLVEGSGVFASDTGTVTYASFSPYCYGNLIVVNHGNGFETFYAHLNGINVVPGQIVFKGNVIGSSGNTGCSSGPHIHFEVRVNGRRDDPQWWLP